MNPTTWTYWKNLVEQPLQFKHLLLATIGTFAAFTWIGQFIMYDWHPIWLDEAMILQFGAKNQTNLANILVPSSAAAEPIAGPLGCNVWYNLATLGHYRWRLASLLISIAACVALGNTARKISGSTYTAILCAIAILVDASYVASYSHWRIDVLAILVAVAPYILISNKSNLPATIICCCTSIILGALTWPTSPIFSIPLSIIWLHKFHNNLFNLRNLLIALALGLFGIALTALTSLWPVILAQVLRGYVIPINDLLLVSPLFFSLLLALIMLNRSRMKASNRIYPLGALAMLAMLGFLGPYVFRYVYWTPIALLALTTIKQSTYRNFLIGMACILSLAYTGMRTIQSLNNGPAPTCSELQTALESSEGRKTYVEVNALQNPTLFNKDIVTAWHPGIETNRLLNLGVENFILYDQSQHVTTLLELGYLENSIVCDGQGHIVLRRPVKHH